MAAGADVRMQGFRRRSEVPAALQWIDGNASCLDAEVVALEAATGRVLARDVIASIDVPGFPDDGRAAPRGEDTPAPAITTRCRWP
jgi:molybdopterin biosynthesis enzyme